MLQKIIVQCQYQGDQRASFNWGSIFHGIIMEMLPQDVVAELHESKLKPFSQYVIPKNERQLEWHIGLWDEYWANHIVKAIMPLTKIELTQKGLVLNIVDIKRSNMGESEFFSRFFNADTPCKRFEIEFITPCTHKQEGNYVLFPSMDLIIHNLSRRLNLFMQDFSLDAPEAMEQVIKNTRIVRYSLRTAVYYLEQTKITGYVGNMTVVVKGPDQLVRLTGSILSFAEYSGIGIKTALGMGGVRIKAIP